MSEKILTEIGKMSVVSSERLKNMGIILKNLPDINKAIKYNDRISICECSEHDYSVKVRVCHEYGNRRQPPQFLSRKITTALLEEILTNKGEKVLNLIINDFLDEEVLPGVKIRDYFNKEVIKHADI